MFIRPVLSYKSRRLKQTATTKKDSKQEIAL